MFVCMEVANNVIPNSLSLSLFAAECLSMLIIRTKVSASWPILFSQ